LRRDGRAPRGAEQAGDLSDGNASSLMFLRLRRLILSKTVPNTISRPARERAGQQNQIINQKEKACESERHCADGRLVRAPIIRNNAPRWDSFTSPAIVATATKRRSPKKKPRLSRASVLELDRRAGASPERRLVMVEGRLRTETRKSASNSTSQPRFPSLCPKIESSSAGMPTAFLSATLTDVIKPPDSGTPSSPCVFIRNCLENILRRTWPMMMRVLSCGRFGAGDRCCLDGRMPSRLVSYGKFLALDFAFLARRAGHQVRKF